MEISQAEREAKIIQGFVSHEGMKLLVERLEKKSSLKKNEWLNAKTVEEAERIRQDGRVYGALMGILNEFLLRGSQAEAQRKSTEGMA